MVSLSAKANCLSVPRTTLRCEIVPSLSLDRTVWRRATADLLQYRERETDLRKLHAQTEGEEREEGRALNVRREIIRVNSRTDNLAGRFFAKRVFFACREDPSMSHTGISLIVCLSYSNILKKNQTLICRIEICHAFFYMCPSRQSFIFYCPPNLLLITLLMLRQFCC